MKYLYSKKDYIDKNRVIEKLSLSDLFTEPLKSHHRLQVFAKKGLICAYCGKEGKFLIKTKDKGGGIHIDLYTEFYEIMTIDHVIPRSKSGSNKIENLVPCCNTCNQRKASTILNNEKEYCNLQ